MLIIMKKLLFVILIILLFSCKKNDLNENGDTTILPSDNLMTWEKCFGGSDYDVIKFVQQTIDGGYILAGYTASFGAGNHDGWLIKTDENGNEKWSQTFGGSDYDYIYSVQQTIDGGYILAGYNESFRNGNYNGWLIKTDENGNEKWSQTFGGSNDDIIYSVQQTTDGGYILAGHTASFADGNYYNADGWLIKTDQTGIKQWSQTFGGSKDNYIRSVQQTIDGGYIMAGDIQSSRTGDHDGWLIKTDESGNKKWSQTFGGNNYDVIGFVQQTIDGGYILAGHTTSFGAGNNDGWLIKIDESGNKKWSQTFGGPNSDSFSSVQQTIDGGYILVGSTTSFGAGYEDGWLIKTDQTGIKKWSQTFGGSNSDSFSSVQQTTDGGYILAGAFRSFGDHNYYDGWLIKIDENENIEE